MRGKEYSRGSKNTLKCNVVFYAIDLIIFT